MGEKEKFMKEALKEAMKAYNKLEIPVGAVIVKDGKIVSRAHNVKEEKKDTTKHAEILAIRKAGKKRNDWRLDGCTMYVTVEPCLMCASCILQSRISRLVFGLREEESGGFGSKYDILEKEIFNFDVKKDVLADESKQLLQGFFKNRRKNQ